MVDNSSNANVFNDNDLFHNILPMEPKNGVETIGGTDHTPAVIGNVSVTWK